jgi:hypothetical protein
VTFAEAGQPNAFPTFGSVADRVYAQSVAIVSCDGLEAFLNADSFHTGDLA